METKFECPRCRQHLSAASEDVGLMAPCPGCGYQVIVPQSRKAIIHRASPRLNLGSRRVVVIVGAALLLLYLLSPYFAIWRLNSALESGDRDALEAQIDFPSVRESLKEQLRIHMAKSM